MGTPLSHDSEQPAQQGGARQKLPCGPWVAVTLGEQHHGVSPGLTICVPPHTTGAQQICPPQGQHKDQITTPPAAESWLTPSVACSLPSPALDT